MFLLPLLVVLMQTTAPPVKVTEAKDVDDVQALNGFVTAFSRNVTACVDAGKPIEACRCRASKEAGNLKKGYENFVTRHPLWQDRQLSYEYVNQDGRTISGVISIPTLKRQLEGLKCDEETETSGSLGDCVPLQAGGTEAIGMAFAEPGAGFWRECDVVAPAVARVARKRRPAGFAPLFANHAVRIIHRARILHDPRR